MENEYYRGYRLSAEDLNKIVNALLERLNVGPGMRKFTVGNKLAIGLTRPRGVGPVGAVGAGGGRIRTVLALPAIPTVGSDAVFWTSAGAGNGDDQIWDTYAGQTAWTPRQFLTASSGTP
jgi:hypothetical protein